MRSVIVDTGSRFVDAVLAEPLWSVFTKRVSDEYESGRWWNAVFESVVSEKLQSAIQGAIAHCKNSLLQNKTIVICKEF
ncbi:hypothetical protein GQ457_14G020440 [Hibiscus cannabinus]